MAASSQSRSPHRQPKTGIAALAARRFDAAWSAQNVHCFTAAARPNIRALVIAPWLLASDCLPIDDSRA